MLSNETPVSVSCLGRVACAAVRRMLPSLINDKANAELLDHTLAENPDLAKDIVRSYVSNLLIVHCYTCSSVQDMEILHARCMCCKKGRMFNWSPLSLPWKLRRRSVALSALATLSRDCSEINVSNCRFGHREP